MTISSTITVTTNGNDVSHTDGSVKSPTNGSVKSPQSIVTPAPIGDATDRSRQVFKDKWYYPAELREGLDAGDLSEEIIQESLACAWEYSRCVIPEWKDWDRYVAFVRTIIIAVVAEFRGDLIPEDSSKPVCGYDLDALLDTLFGGTTMHKEMSQEFRAFMLMSAEKSRKRLDTGLFRRYLHALTESPESWFRLRDCDALARYTMASALVCNSYDDVLFNETQWQLIAEMADTLYDAVAYYKHRAEGETNSTFGYVGGDARIESFRVYREALWALDAVWGNDPAKRCILNFTRFFGGPIHMTTRRYRFIEDGLMIGRPESEKVVQQTRDNFKLWNRVEEVAPAVKDERYAEVMAEADKVMFPKFRELLESSASLRCQQCTYVAPTKTKTKTKQKFGGVQLCDGCKQHWGEFMQSFPTRFAAAFPEVKLVGY